MSKQVLARLGASAPRRVFAVGAVGLLGALFMYLAVDMPDGSALIRAILVMAGLLILIAAHRQWRATGLTLELTEDALRDSTGRILVRIDNIDTVERGSFAFKPTNGFLLVTKDAQPKAWAPGIWWRVGRRIGIGGVCRAADTKAMAEILAGLIAARRDGA